MSWKEFLDGIKRLVADDMHVYARLVVAVYDLDKRGYFMQSDVEVVLEDLEQAYGEMDEFRKDVERVLRIAAEITDNEGHITAHSLEPFFLRDRSLVGLFLMPWSNAADIWDKYQTYRRVRAVCRSVLQDLRTNTLRTLYVALFLVSALVLALHILGVINLDAVLPL